MGQISLAATFTTRQTPSNGEEITVDSADTYYFDPAQVFDIETHSNVILTNNGKIIAHKDETQPTESIACADGCNNTVDASGSTNFTLTNNGTIWAGEHLSLIHI